MRAARQFAFVMLLMLAARALPAGEVIDRIVATIGKHAILESELDEAARFEAFTAGRSLESVTAADVKAALDRFVDQQLIRDAAGVADSPVLRDEDVNKEITRIRSQLPGAATEDGWRAVLGVYGLSEGSVRSRLRAQLETMQMVNQTLRPSVRVDQAEIETYYDNEFLPKLRQAGATDVPLPNVSPRIRQILVEQRMGELLESWLRTLRARNDIRIDLAEPDSVGVTNRPPSTGSATGERFAHSQ